MMMLLDPSSQKGQEEEYVPTYVPVIKRREKTLKKKIQKILPYLLLFQFIMVLFLLFTYLKFPGIIPLMLASNENSDKHFFNDTIHSNHSQ